MTSATPLIASAPPTDSPADNEVLPAVEILGLSIHALRMNQVLEFLGRRIRTRQPVLVGVVNAAKLVHMRQDPFLCRAVASADLVLADGMAVVWASRLLRRPLPERVTGIDLMHRLLEVGSRLNYRVFLLGATHDVLNAVTQRMALEYPGAVLAGAHHGYFRPDEEPALAEKIRLSKPDVLLVAMTSPKKERFLARWSGELGVPVCHGVGGSFDVWAGKVRRAPAIWQQLGLEWLFRVLQEPKRLWRRYLVTNVLFMWLVLKQLLSRRAPALVESSASS